MIAKFRCHLCLSDRIKTLFRIEEKSRTYTICFCNNCEVIQTLEHYEEVSPDYTHLSNDKINADRLWCQAEHKLSAFSQWHFQATQLLKHKTDSLLLDIGCGTGGFLKFARDMGFCIYGFDASRAQISFAQMNFPNVRLAFSPKEYLHSLGNVNLKFDIITLWDVIEHLREPLIFLKEVKEVLKPEGLLYISTPNAKALLWKKLLYLPNKKQYNLDLVPWEHVFYYSTKSLRLWLTKLGFDVLKTGAVACYHRPLSLFELFRRLGFFLLAAFPSQSPQIYAWSKNLSED